MGIKSLNKFLKKFTVYETFHISKLEYKKIAIDTPLFLYKFKSVHQDNNWIGCFINLISFLRNWNIHPIFVFEGQSPPEKYATLAGRRDQREKMVQKTNMLQESYTTYETTGEMPPLLQELLSKSTLKSIPNIIDARRKYEIIITSDDICLLKKAFDIMHIDYIQSKGEAEAECANLFYSNQIDFIVSEEINLAELTDNVVYAVVYEAPYKTRQVYNLYTPTYGDQPGVVQTSTFTLGGSDTSKTLLATNLQFAPLTAGQSVTLKYKADYDTAWTTICVADTDNDIEYTSINIESTGVNLPTFNEIAFRIESLGGAELTGFKFKAEEHEDIYG
jgi:hypothetical protein